MRAHQLSRALRTKAVREHMKAEREQEDKAVQGHSVALQEKALLLWSRASGSQREPLGSGLG